MISLKEARENANLSQSQLSELTGVNLHMIQYYEQGRKDLNRAEGYTLYLLAKALGVAIEDLINTGNESASMRLYSIKEKIVLAGDSKVFNDWHDNAGITQAEFLEDLRWLCNDPFPSGKLSRELGCIPPSKGSDKGTLVRLKRVLYNDGSFCGFYTIDTGALWTGSISISARDRI